MNPNNKKVRRTSPRPFLTKERTFLQKEALVLKRRVASMSDNETAGLVQACKEFIQTVEKEQK